MPKILGAGIPEAERHPYLEADALACLDPACGCTFQLEPGDQWQRVRREMRGNPQDEAGGEGDEGDDFMAGRLDIVRASCPLCGGRAQASISLDGVPWARSPATEPERPAADQEARERRSANRPPVDFRLAPRRAVPYEDTVDRAALERLTRVEGVEERRR